MFKWFKRKKKEEVKAVPVRKATGLPVDVLQGRILSGTSQRNLNRIKICQKYVKQHEDAGDTESEQYLSWLAELHVRTAAMKKDIGGK